MMLRLLCLFVGLVATVSGACKDPFVQVGEGCYYFSSYEDRMSWYEAREYCHNLGADVDLAVFDYLCNDYQQVANYILTSGPSIIFYYVGAAGGQLSWFWLDGRSLSVSSTHWNVFSPNLLLHDGCVYIYRYSSGDYDRMYLGHSSCSTSESFICQQNIQPITRNRTKV